MTETTTATLDAAWAEAEAALPEWVRRQQAKNADEEWGDPEDYTLAVQRDHECATAWAYDRLTDAPDPIFAIIRHDGPTPADALRALASVLREQSR